MGFDNISVNHNWKMTFESMVSSLNDEEKNHVYKVINHLNKTGSKIDFIPPETLIKVIRNINDVQKTVIYLRFVSSIKHLDSELEKLIKENNIVADFLRAYLDIHERANKKSSAPAYTLMIEVPPQMFLEAIRCYKNDSLKSKSLTIFLYVYDKFKDLDPVIMNRILHYIIKHQINPKVFLYNLDATPVHLQKYMIRKIMLWTDDPETYSRKLKIMDYIFNLNSLQPERFYEVVLRGEIDPRVRAVLDNKSNYLLDLRKMLEKHFNQDEISEAILNFLETTKKYVFLHDMKLPITYNLDIMELDQKLQLLKRYDKLNSNILKDKDFLFERFLDFKQRLKLASKNRIRDFLSSKISYSEIKQQSNKNPQIYLNILYNT